jgi:hypothetical protein
VAEGDVMSDQSSELVEISKLNGDFRRNYGKLIGAFLYLRSVSAARGRSILWNMFAVVIAFLIYWLRTYGWHLPA